MSILNDLPHVCTAKRRTIGRAGSLGGTAPTFPTTVFSARTCWRQNAKDEDITEFSKKGMAVTDRFYFTTDPGLSEEDVLTDVRNKGTTAGTGDGDWEVRSRAEPDASAGLGVVYRVMAEKTTTGST